MVEPGDTASVEELRSDNVSLSSSPSVVLTPRDRIGSQASNFSLDSADLCEELASAHSRMSSRVATVDYDCLVAAKNLQASGGSTMKAPREFETNRDQVDESNIISFVPNIDEYELTNLKEDAKKIREKLFRAQQELVSLPQFT